MIGRHPFGHCVAEHDVTEGAGTRHQSVHWFVGLNQCCLLLTVFYSAGRIGGIQWDKLTKLTSLNLACNGEYEDLQGVQNKGLSGLTGNRDSRDVKQD